MASQELEVIAVCQSAADRPQLAKLKRDWWSEETRPVLPKCVVLRSGVREKTDLRAATRSALEHPGENILFTFGYPENEVRSFMSEIHVPLQVAGKARKRPARGDKRNYPSASLLGATGDAPLVMFGEDPVATLRKAAICQSARQSMKVRLLEEGDLDAYFSLRYSVWRALDYIPEERICEKSRWEVDYTDRSSIPIGVFRRDPGSGDEQLVACGRLVSGLGDEEPRYRDMVERQVQARSRQADDPRLLKNFGYPANLQHPFDILDSFPGFHYYYRDLVKRRVKRAEISRIIVDNKFRGRGLGEVVVDSLVDLARDKNIRVLFLACIDRHATFYNRCGFSVVPDLSCGLFANVNVPAVVMHRNMAAS